MRLRFRLRAASTRRSYEDYCTFETLGTCWPAEAGGFRCACNGEEAPLIERAEQRCSDAIFRACGAACEEEAGCCEPLVEATGFECACEARTTTREGEVECIYALDAACHPECEHAAGQCFVASDHRGVECRCGQDPDLTTVLYNDVGHDDCDGILEELCGPNPDQPETCERVGMNASGNCRLPSNGGFACSCMVGTDSHAGGGSPAAASCLEQLMQFCPEAFE